MSEVLSIFSILSSSREVMVLVAIFHMGGLHARIQRELDTSSTRKRYGNFHASSSDLL